VASAAIRWSTGQLGLPAVVAVAIGRFDSVVGLGLAALLRSDERVRVRMVDLADFERECVLRERPDVAILAQGSGPADVERLQSVCPGTSVLVFAHSVTHAEGLRFLVAGANCVSLSVPDVDVLAAVHETARGARFFIAGDGRRVERRYPRDAAPLTKRERQVLALLVKDASYPQVAAALGVSIRTAEKHAGNLLRKLQVRSKRDLIGMPLSAGLVRVCG
jgi:DNA-binding NarL/FixJ family response regulator